jgi:uncharacterized protein YjbI with pentapeptide repeats
MTQPTLSLKADCESCFGLCCVAPAFSASADFAIDKDAGQPCPNLQADYRCGIHANLRGRGFGGCATFDCFGAGQQVSQVTFGGRSWREDRRTAQQMFGVFAVLRQLHELLWYLTEALTLPAAKPLHSQLRVALDETECLTGSSAETLLALDVAAHHQGVDPLLVRTSELTRAGVRHRKDHNHADLIRAKLRGADLKGANLRGAYLIGADLRRADLTLADVIGADFRAADLRGADLSESLFLTQFQAGAATGDDDTRLPAALARRAHWSR